MQERNKYMRKGKRTIGAFVAVISLSAANIALSDDKLDENKIGEILTTSFTDLKNVTKYACVNLFDLGPKLPGNLETASLTYRNQKGVIRKDIAALISSGLITVRLDSGKGSVTTVGYSGKKTRQDVPLSYVDLTPLGMSFYRYDDAELINMPKDTYGENRFCAYIQYGGIERFMKPAKNPFDNNPHLVTWVEFCGNLMKVRPRGLPCRNLRRDCPFTPKKTAGCEGESCLSSMMTGTGD